MPKFKCIEVYTPDDQKLPRDRKECTFCCSSKDLLDIAKAALAEFGGVGDFFEMFKDDIKDSLEGYEWCDTPEDNGFEFTFQSNNGQFFYDIQQLPPSPETPITDENIVAWAENRAALSPTFEDRVLCEKSGEYRNVTRANTAEREIGLVLSNRCMSSFQEYDKGELLDFISGILWDGTKGYKDMTMPELLAEFKDLIVQPEIDNAEGGVVYLEDLPLNDGD